MVLFFKDESNELAYTRKKIKRTPTARGIGKGRRMSVTANTTTTEQINTCNGGVFQADCLLIKRAALSA